VIKLSTNLPSSATDRTEVFLRSWTAAACDVLEKITGSPFAATDLPPQEVAEQLATLRQGGSWLRFTCSAASSPPLKGEQSLGISNPDALRCAQILMGEPSDAARDFSSEYQDALDELFRQFAGAASSALKPQVGAEVNLQLAGHDPGKWKPSVQWGARLKSESSVQLVLMIALDPDLTACLASASTVRTPPVASSSVNSAPMENRNIDLLLDVELPVALRFGKSEMTLSRILELSAGAVVELDQKILEPVELLVGDKVVAQGEVVVMDGHYALRVVEVLNTRERLESLQSSHQG